MFDDKCRKRGLRIAQKATKRNHSRDRRRSWPGESRSKLHCYMCKGYKRKTCKRCARMLYHMAGGDVIDYDMAEYLNTPAGD